MNDFKIFIFYSIVFALFLVIPIFINQLSWLVNYLVIIKPIVEIFSPIGILILGFLGINQWKREYTFRKRNELAADIASNILELKNSLDKIRMNWPIIYSSAINKIDDVDKEEAFSKLPITHLNFRFSEETINKLDKRIVKAIRKKDNLEQKLKIASILWNMNDIEKSANKLFLFFYDIINAIYRLQRRKGYTQWDFVDIELEEDNDLKFILQFEFNTKNKSRDELNSYYVNEFNSRSKIILNNISNFLY